MFFLPGSPDNPKPLLSKGFIRFTEKDQAARLRQLELDGPGEKGGSQGMEIPFRVVWKTLIHYRRWPHLFQRPASFDQEYVSHQAQGFQGESDAKIRTSWSFGLLADANLSSIQAAKSRSLEE